MVIHPFLGYVHNPDAVNANHKLGPASDYGFLDGKNPIFEHRDDTLVVAVFGGSVSWWLAYFGEPIIADSLSKINGYKNKKIRVLRFGFSGGRQPQQLAALSYLLALGAQLDVVVNIDGFNEISLPRASNLDKGINPAFPTYWHELFSVFKPSAQSAAAMKLLGELSLKETSRKQAAEIASAFPWKYSIAANTLWSLYDSALANSENEIRFKIAQQKKNEAKVPYVLRGPRFNKTGMSINQSFVELWKNSSLQMNALCRANGIEYFHFLQPNQYLPHSKPLSKEELKSAYDKTIFYRPEVEASYPLLIKEGKNLLARGVKFHDLTMIFKTTAESMYTDNCCHLNHDGNIKFARIIGDIIADDLIKQA